LLETDNEVLQVSIALVLQQLRGQNEGILGGTTGRQIEAVAIEVLNL